MTEKILFLVTDDFHGSQKAHMIVRAASRENAKGQCKRWLSGNPDKYVVTPLTQPGDLVNVSLIFTN